MPFLPGHGAYATQGTGDFVDTNTRDVRTRDGCPGAKSTVSGGHPKFIEPQLHT